jgi:hypothetical protein
MVHKLQQADDQLKSYLVDMDLRDEPVDVTITQSEFTITIILLSFLGALIFLNISFYLLYRRITRIKIEAHDITLMIQPPSDSQELNISKDSQVFGIPKCASDPELNGSNDINVQMQSYSETDLSNFL